MMNALLKNLLRTCAAVVVVSFVLAGCNNNKGNPTAAYVLTQKLFKDFQGTKELDKKIIKLEEKQKYILDSLLLEIKSLEAVGNNPPQKINLKKETYNRLLTEFSQSNQQQNQEYTDALWKQINQYVNDYGKEKGYGFIHGADGGGNIMYADSTLNVTDDVLNYMNEKYAGK